MLTWIFFFFPFQFLFLLSNIDVRFRSQMTLLLAENIMKYMCFVELEWTSEWHRFIQAYNYLRWFSSQLSQLHVWGKFLTTEVSSSLSGESCITQDKSHKKLYTLPPCFHVRKLNIDITLCTCYDKSTQFM